MNLTKEHAETLGASLDIGTWTKTLELDGGYSIRAKLEYDDTRLGDWYGTLHDAPRDSRERPAACNGAARKIQTRGGALWWQPPADLLADPDNLAALEKRVRGYYLEDWSYVGVVLEMRTPACACCGERKTHVASLWGIESDAGDYFAEVIADLASEWTAV